MLPWQIATAINKEANLMLELYIEIAEKLMPILWFHTTITKKKEQKLLYTPGCIQEIQNPCIVSPCIKESDEFKLIVSKNDEGLKVFRILKETYFKNH